MEKHEHVKVYEKQYLTSLPPKVRWICKVCLEEGVDTVGEYQEDEYKRLKKEKENVAVQ